MKEQNKKYVAYYRVSTERQGESGLGLQSQKQAVMNYVKPNKNLIGEYTDIESGKNASRPELLKAINYCKETGAILLIAKLDRLSRNAKFIFTLRDSNVKFISIDMPDANNLTIGIMAVLAQDEAERISGRTVNALNQIKENIKRNGYHISKAGNKITKLGKNNITEQARLKSIQVRREKFLNNPDMKKAFAMISSLKENGYNLTQIAEVLNNSGFKTIKGKDFKTTTVKRVYEKFKRK